MVAVVAFVLLRIIMVTTAIITSTMKLLLQSKNCNAERFHVSIAMFKKLAGEKTTFIDMPLVNVRRY